MLSLMLAGCSSLATFLADNIPQWAGGLPREAPPRVGDPRYADYFKMQIAARKSIEQRRLTGVQSDEQTDRIERAQAAGGHISRSVSARTVLRDAPLAGQDAEAVGQASTGFSLNAHTLY